MDDNNDDGSAKEVAKPMAAGRVVYMDESPECPVCLQQCVQPVQLPCLHTFCFLCLKGFAYRGNKCAICRDVIEFEYFNNPIIVKVGNTTTEEEDRKEKTHVWFYKGNNGWWKYDDGTSITIENAFTEDNTAQCEVIISGFAYIIDLDKMIQYRKSNPARVRNVKRDLCEAVTVKGVAGLRTKDTKENYINATMCSLQQLSVKGEPP